MNHLMRICTSLSLAGLCIGLLGLAICITPRTAAAQDIFTVTFDDKEIDQPIGTGGVSVGEPSWLDSGDLQAIVRAEPFATSSLEVNLLSTSGQMGFVLPSVVSTGIVALVSDVWLYEGNECTTTIKLLSSLGQPLVMLEFGQDGTFRIADTDGNVIDSVPFATGRPLPILMVVDFDERLYSVWVDSVQQVVDHPLFSEIQDLRQAVLRLEYNCPAGNRFSIDQIRLLAHAPQVPTESRTWGGVRALYR